MIKNVSMTERELDLFNANLYLSKRIVLAEDNAEQFRQWWNAEKETTEVLKAELEELKETLEALESEGTSEREVRKFFENIEKRNAEAVERIQESRLDG